MNATTELSNIDVKLCELLSPGDDGLLYYPTGEWHDDGDQKYPVMVPVARLKINWGWSRWYDSESGSGFGTVRNTGYFACDEQEFRDYCETQAE